MSPRSIDPQKDFVSHAGFASGRTGVIFLEVSVMGQKIGTEKITREDGFLYYIGKDGFVWAAPMKHNKKGKKKKIGTEKIAKQSGYMYYLGKDGYVYKAKLKNA